LATLRDSFSRQDARTQRESAHSSFKIAARWGWMARQAG
jgi:hypothetical protein